jgi:hypothetical protein
MASSSKTKVWWVKLGKLGIGYWDDINSEMKSFSAADITSGDTIRILYRRKPTKLTSTLSGKPDVPEQFHKAIMYRVMEQLSARKGDYKGAKYYQSEYEKCLIMAKKYTNKGRDGSYVSIVHHEY